MFAGSAVALPILILVALGRYRAFAPEPGSPIFEGCFFVKFTDGHVQQVGFSGSEGLGAAAQCENKNEGQGDAEWLLLGNVGTVLLEELRNGVCQYVSVATPDLGALGADLHQLPVHIRVESIVSLSRLPPDSWQLGSRLLEVLQFTLRFEEYVFELA